MPAWFRAGVVGACWRQVSDGDRVAEQAVAADRFAREIVGFLMAFPALAAAERQALDGISSFTQTCLYYLLFDTLSLNG